QRVHDVVAHTARGGGVKAPPGQISFSSISSAEWICG
ncbi:MAG: hypothetical protein ACI87W_001829, partial [Halieaceae bacterium]